MRVFVTGASGWIGSAVVPELIDAGHHVVGLARSQASAALIEAAGATSHPGSIDDLDSLREGAAHADAVIHLAFRHDFSDFAASGRSERAVIATFVEALEGSDRPFLFASGAGGITPGRVANENDRLPAMGADGPRGGGEELAFAHVENGVHAVALRFSTSVHGENDHGFVAQLVRIAREKGVSAYIGDGSNRWPAVHRLDAAQLVRLALEKAPAGSAVHAVADQGVPTREIAETIGRGLDLPIASVAPEQAAEHFGWLGSIFALDIPASSAITQQQLGWTPTHPGLIADLAAGHYFRSAS
ncbi:SDR family oxidoreductase [Microbacterium protaetiae]|uniref:SDR family oxidoreductase n=2 Tax=Microbacterium protaetiae TaxID=2509458 RepID=A0A4P6EUV1_9MICO|nr:SDR family oxidoreductase [Microbacterium protaetiae]